MKEKKREKRKEVVKSIQGVAQTLNEYISLLPKKLDEDCLVSIYDYIDALIEFKASLLFSEE